jgi:hypothetical protein
MNIFSWLIVIGLILFCYIGFAIIAELRQLRAVVAERIGSIAEAAWRVRDELIQINKRTGA